MELNKDDPGQNKYPDMLGVMENELLIDLGKHSMSTGPGLW